MWRPAAPASFLATMRDAIPPSQRLSISLRYLATENTFEDLKSTSAISLQSIGKIVMYTCTALIHGQKDYINVIIQNHYFIFCVY
jgi:hypothetical protein